MKYRNRTHSQIAISGVEFIQIDSVDEALAQNIELIDISYEEFNQLKGTLHKESLQVYQVGFADAVILKNQIYQFMNLNYLTLTRLITDRKIKLNTSQPALLIGGLETHLSFIPCLAQLGFKRLIVASDKVSRDAAILQKVMRGFLGIQVQIIEYDKVSLIEETCSILLAEFSHLEFQDLSETLSYFNFLTSDSTFIDLRSEDNASLAEEVQRAGLEFVSQGDFFLNRIALAQKLRSS